MKLSAFSVVDMDHATPGRPAGRLGEVVALAEAAEAAGLDAIWVAEHHFHPGGVCPSPPVLLAACGARTRRLRLGSLVSVLPFHRPVDLAEEYSMVDQLTNGRLNLGLGSGYIPLECDGFGVDLGTKRARFDTALETMLAAFRGEEIRIDGGTPVRLNVQPVQRPHPPVWVAVQRREAIRHVAARGWSIAMIPYATVENLDQLAEAIREYRAHLPAGRRGVVSVAVHLYAGDDPRPARIALQRYLDARLRGQSTFYQEKVRHDPHAGGVAGLEAAGFALLGPAEEVAERSQAYARIGVDELIGIFDFGGLSPETSAASVRSLGKAWVHAPLSPAPVTGPPG